MPIRSWTDGTLALALAVAALAVAACGGEESAPETAPGGQSAPAPTVEPPPPSVEETTTEEAPAKTAPKPLPGVPRFTAGFRGWVKLNASPIPPRDADPHSGTKNVYASRNARPDGSFRYGTIVVKEARRPGADFVGLIAVMRKLRNANPDHNDWVFVEYTRGSRGEPFQELASGSVCTSCHMGAASSDYVFTAAR